MFRIIATTAAILLLAAPGVLADGRRAGSVGIFPIHRTNSTNPADPNSFTIVSLTNTNTSPVSGETLVHYEYVNVVDNPANAFQPIACIVFDRIEVLTPADTFSVLTSCHNPGQSRGYLVVSAQDPAAFNKPWSFNYLIGSELVVNGSGSSFSLPMIAIESPLADFECTDEPQGGGQFLALQDGRLDFDDVEYDSLSDLLYIDSFIAVVESHLTLINLTGGPNALNTVHFSIWNDNEFPLSTQLTFRCWFDEPLSNISPLFTQSFLANNTPDDPAELSLACMPDVQTFETGWAIIDSIDVSEPGGTFIASDGAMLGAISGSTAVAVDGAHLLWEGGDQQLNGVFLEP